MSKRYKVEVYATTTDFIRLDVFVEAENAETAKVVAGDPSEWIDTGPIDTMECLSFDFDSVGDSAAEEVKG